MADEQIIYLSPEEELTSVRERLAQVKPRRIILVIPPQTHLRSHVGWRVLHARMRELGKEVLVISSDRQIRAVAKAVGFRIADSLESPSSNRPRPASRPGRMAPGGKTTRPRSAPPAKGTVENRTSPQRQKPAQRALDEQLAQQPPREAESKISSAGEAITGKGADFSSSTFGEDDYDSPGDQPTPPPAPPRGTNTSRAGQVRREEYEFHIETSPPVSPRVPEHDDEEFPDSFIDHYNQAQFIRQRFQAEEPTSKRPANAAGIGERSTPPLTPSRGGGDRPSPPPATARGTTTSRQGDEDVYAYYLEDSHPVSLPEQQGSALVEDIDTGIPDLSDIPTDILEGEIEDLGDEGAIPVQPEAMRQSWDEPIEDEMERPYSPHVYGSRPQSNRSGSLRPQQPQPEPDIDDEDMLAPVADRPTLVRPPSPVRRSSTLPPAASSNRGSQPIIPPQTRNGQPKPASQQAKKPAKKGRTVTTSPQRKPAAAVQTPARRRNNRKTLTAFLAVVAVLLILAGLFIFVPSAQVTISVPSYPLTISPLHLSASTNATDKAHNTMASVVLNYDKSVPGKGNATGTSQVGNAQATGLVNFTNRGTQQIEIPTGVSLATSNGIQFVTTADALIPPSGSNNPNPPIPVQAVKTGVNGNVAAGSITVIPSDGLKKIAQYNNNVPVSSLNLSVTNPAKLTGGGTAPATSVTNNDIQAEKAILDRQLQGDFKTWLAQNVHKGDIQGTPVLQSETVTTTPAKGQVTNDGKFSETIRVHITVLVVRAAALQAAAAGQLNAAALKMNPSYVLVAGQAVTLSKTKSSASKDGSSISISLDARGQIMQRVSVDTIRNALAGKTRDQATSDITNGLGGLHSVFNTAIQVSPGFLTILPFRADRITVILKPVPTNTTPTKGMPNG